MTKPINEMTTEEFRDYLQLKKNELDSAGEQLKSHFIGLDNIIDEILNSMLAWYTIPSVITIPTPICLWGMTGTGKTDLVRRLVKILGFNDRFVEIQLSTKGNTWEKNIQDVIEESNLESGKPGILLLDEIQRYRTVDERGGELRDYNFQDIWSLLSDGKFSQRHDSNIQLIRMLFDMEYHEERYEEEDDIVESVPSKKEKLKSNNELKYHCSWWQAQEFKKILGIPNSIAEIATWPKEKIMHIAKSKVEDKSTDENNDYSKLLIFIAGNLDEAFRMAFNTDDADSDADILHNFSINSVTILTIKEALKTRFKPEQIARFGNKHIIYPCMNKATYEEIIKRKIQNFIDRVKSNIGVDVEVDHSINELIYRNGVFPVQGTRPLFSTISQILESQLPSFILHTLNCGWKQFIFRYNESTKKLEALLPNDNNLEIPFHGKLDILRDKSKFNIDKKYMLSVHESGHAVACAVLFGIVPPEITVVRTDGGGNTTLDIKFIDSVEMIEKDIICGCAGSAAVSMIFGRTWRTAGSTGDILNATKQATKLIRETGICGKSSFISSSDTEDPGWYVNNDIDSTNHLIESLVKQCQDKAFEIVSNHKEALVRLTYHLIKNGKSSSIETYEIFKQSGIDCQIKEANYEVLPPYKDKFESFVQTLKSGFEI